MRYRGLDGCNPWRKRLSRKDAKQVKAAKGNAKHVAFVHPITRPAHHSIVCGLWRGNHGHNVGAAALLPVPRSERTSYHRIAATGAS
jgi:hypothetical protein